MKFFCASMIHETNCFSPIPTNLDSFRELFLYLPSYGEGLELENSQFEGVHLAQMAKSRGHTVINALMASAEPSAPALQRDYEVLRNEIISSLESAGEVDAVALFLHGAQISENCDDCEGDLLKHIRAVVGPDIPIGVEFDPHSHITTQMLDHATILVSSQEYPHTDFELRAEHLLHLLEQSVRGGIKPTISFCRIPMLGSYFTNRHPMRDFVDRILEHESRHPILSVSLIHGFPWADTEDVGASVIVVTDDAQDKGDFLASQIAQNFFSIREQVTVAPLRVDEALEQATAFPTPVVIADITDNPGGGAPSDSTHLLRAIIDRHCGRVALGMIWDPVAAMLAASAGVGSNIPLRIGAKVSELSGNPVDANVEVISVKSDAFQIAQGRKSSLGLTVAVKIGSIHVVINTIRQQVFSPECFRVHGIEPSEMDVVVVKSHQHFVETFSEFAAKILYASPPGVVERDFSKIPYKRLQRPVWPLDQTPFTAFGKNWE